jgi:ribosomal protein L40E
MAAKYSNTYILNANMGHVCSVIRDAQFCNFLKLNFKAETPMQGGTIYSFSSGVNLASWGENIDINVLYLNENTSQVIIKSECAMPTQIIDWGRNEANVGKIYNHLLSSIAYNPTFNNTPPQPVINQVYNQNFNNVQPQQAAMVNFCRNCGTQLDPTARFCQKCGSQVLRN